ncbi:hypothetical protein Poli38472_010081 [Pythium oligandrum]|uniref:3'-5' exonuclease domain-containing protein n=1 Tax=Pythium oligandrum TaxID=41045 RepID=A0A8K1C8I0_PYTOL|nr:hypothetical protein Poli38472_010081 [Pythium oligandrum]|eukprot:TMW58522.1 hypothetical protein Poli38472_010081 [Pythium oligandrum]
MVEMATDAGWYALSRRFYGRKVVRDLLWSVTSPHVINRDLYPVLPADFGLVEDEKSCELLVQWLDDLQADPTHLFTFLQEKTKSKKTALALGVYFASLLEYWLRHCPVLRVEKFENSKQIISATYQTLGQLKFLFRRFFDPASDSFDDFHVESSVKFFLLHPLDEQFKQSTPISESPDADTSAESSFYPLEQFVGPHLGENLAWRVQEVARKLDMCRGESVQAWLRDHYSDNVLSRIVLRGYLFYPLRLFASTSEVTQGHDWRFHANPLDKPTKDVRHNKSIGADHLRGWWTSDLEAEFVSKVDVNDKERIGESRFVVLPKLHWLSPVIADEDPADSNRVVVTGEDVLQIETVEALTLTEVIAHARNHFATLADSTEAQNRGGVVMPLLVAEIIRCQPRDVEFDPSIKRWKELSRGFLLDPKCWDPLPLCHDAVRFKRTTHQANAAVNTREYEGRREWLNNGVIKPTDREAELLRLQKMHSFADMETLTAPAMCQELLKVVDTRGHANLKHSIVNVLQYQAAHKEQCDGVNSVLSYVLEGLKSLALEQSLADSKVAQRVGHLVLDAVEAMKEIKYSSEDRDASVDFFLLIASDEVHWSYTNLALRLCDMILSRGGGDSALSSPRSQAITDVLEKLLTHQNAKQNALAVEMVRVFRRETLTDERRSRDILDLLIELLDWQNAERLVTVTEDVELLSVLFRQLSRRGMTKALKRLRRLITRLHFNEDESLGDPAGSAVSRLPQHALGPAVDVEANRELVATQLPTFRWEFVDSSSQLASLMDGLHSIREKQEPSIIGLDCEWRPQAFINHNGKTTSPGDTLGSNQGDDDEEIDEEVSVGADEGVSVYQLSIGNITYIVDVQTLGEEAAAPLEMIWSDPSLFFLVGFCVSGDLRRLHHSFPSVLGKRSESPLLVELKQMALYRQLPASKWGLSQLYETCFGEQLDKEQQCSDWALRPLSTQQLEYAAMDAFVVRKVALLLLADVVESKPLAEYVRKFAVVTTITHTERELGHWITTLEPLTTSHVRVSLEACGLQAVEQKIFTLDKATWDGCARQESGLIVKTIAVVIRRGKENKDIQHAHYAAVVLHVERSIDMKALSQAVDAEESDLMLADKETLLRVFGYRRGSVGPIGLREQDAIQVVLDAALLQEASILCGAGQEDVVYPIHPSTLVETMHAQVAGISS